MLSLFLCLVLVILKAEARDTETEDGVIRLSFSNDRNEEFTVWKDRPLKIIIENAYARYIWCVNKYVKQGLPLEYFVPETEFPNPIVSILEIKQVTNEMNTRWACTVLQEYHGGVPYPYKNRNYTAKDLHFHLYVQGARQVILTANYNYNLTYNVATNQSVQYYGSANYTYVDGEDVEFTCKKNQTETHPSDTLRLEYFNAKGILLFQTKSQTKPHKFRSVLKSTNDKYYLDCICASIGPVREYRYRTTFYAKRDTGEHAIMVSVNGQKLTTISNMDKSVANYIFKYIDGEILNVTCQNNMSFSALGTLYFSFDPSIIYRMGPWSPAIISTKILASKINKKTVTCSINNTDAKQPNAEILFLSDVSDRDVRVRGLPRNNILYQYTNDLNQWTIEYQYSVKETLNLTCVFKSGLTNPVLRTTGFHSTPEFQWKIKGTYSIYPANWTRDLPNTKFSNEFTNILDTTHNGKKIKCIYYPQGTYNYFYNETVEIVLRLKPEIASEEKGDEVNAGDTDKKDTKVQMIVPIAVFFGVTVAITTILCLVCWRKRTKRANLIENAYDTLSNQNTSPIPEFPSQWEANYDDSHYANIDEEVMQENYNYSTDNDKLYRMPFKRESNNSENHYTEIDDYFKPRPSGQTTNWNKVQPAKYNKDINTLKETASLNSDDANYNNVVDSQQGTYDKLMHNNLPINKTNDNYSNVQSKGKSKNVTFSQISTILRPERNLSEGNSKQGRNNDQTLKQNNGGHYANTDQDIYMQPGDMQKKLDYENNFTKNKETVNPLDLDYAEPYGDLGISFKNDLWG